MKCIFCKEPCRLLRRGEPDYHKSEMIWFCDKHPSVNHVKSRVRIRSYYQRKNHKKYGTIREWDFVEVRWNKGKNQIWRAYWLIDDDEKPGSFYVTVEIPKKKKVRKPTDPWEPTESTALELEEWPAGFTPENVQKKVATYLIFS